MYRGIEQSKLNLSRSQFPPVGHSQGFYSNPQNVTSRRLEDALQSALESSSFGIPVDNQPDVSVAEIENALQSTQNQQSTSQYQPRPHINHVLQQPVPSTPQSMYQPQPQTEGKPSYVLKPLPSVLDRMNQTTLQTPRPKEVPSVPIFPHTVEHNTRKPYTSNYNNNNNMHNNNNNMHNNMHNMHNNTYNNNLNTSTNLGLSAATVALARDKPFTADALHVTTTPRKATLNSTGQHGANDINSTPAYQVTVMNTSLLNMSSTTDISDNVEHVVARYRQELALKRQSEESERKKMEQRTLILQQEQALLMQREQLRQQYLPPTPVKIVLEIKSPQKSIEYTSDVNNSNDPHKNMIHIPLSSIPLEEALQQIVVDKKPPQQYLQHQQPYLQQHQQQPQQPQQPQQQQPQQGYIYNTNNNTTNTNPITNKDQFDDLLAFDTHKLEDAAKKRRQDHIIGTSINNTVPNPKLNEKITQLEKLTTMQKEVELLLHATLAKKEQELKQQKQENISMREQLDHKSMILAHEQLRLAEEEAHNVSGFTKGQLVTQQQTLSEDLDKFYSNQ